MTNSNPLDFSDLEDLNSLKSSTAKHNGKGNFPCVKCGGTGKVTFGYVNIRTGKCHACNGRGFFMTSPEKRAKARAKSASKKQAKAQERQRRVNELAVAYRENHKDLIEYMEAVAGWNSFAINMLAAIEQWGQLTEGQERAAYNAMAKHIDRQEEQKKREENAPVLDLTRINKMFDTAKENGLKKPALRVGNMVISVAPSSGKNIGFLYVKHDGEYGGKISPEGKFFAVRNAPDNLQSELEAIAADPMGKLTEHGRITGNCSCCGRELTNKESIERGIGPICAAKYGLL